MRMVKESKRRLACVIIVERRATNGLTALKPWTIINICLLSVISAVRGAIWTSTVLRTLTSLNARGLLNATRPREQGGLNKKTGLGTQKYVLIAVQLTTRTWTVQSPSL